MDERKIKAAVRKRIAVKPGLAAKALGLGAYKLKRKIEDGSVPTNGVGNIPSSWLLEQMKFNRRGGEAA